MCVRPAARSLLLVSCFAVGGVLAVLFAERFVVKLCGLGFTLATPFVVYLWLNLRVCFDSSEWRIRQGSREFVFGTGTTARMTRYHQMFGHAHVLELRRPRAKTVTVPMSWFKRSDRELILSWIDEFGGGCDAGASKSR